MKAASVWIFHQNNGKQYRIIWRNIAYKETLFLSVYIWQSYMSATGNKNLWSARTHMSELDSDLSHVRIHVTCWEFALPNNPCLPKLCEIKAAKNGSRCSILGQKIIGRKGGRRRDGFCGAKKRPRRFFCPDLCIEKTHMGLTHTHTQKVNLMLNFKAFSLKIIDVKQQ